MALSDQHPSSRKWLSPISLVITCAMSVFCGLPNPLQLLGAEFLPQGFQTQVQEGVGHD